MWGRLLNELSDPTGWHTPTAPPPTPGRAPGPLPSCGSGTLPPKDPQDPLAEGGEGGAAWAQGGAQLPPAQPGQPCWHCQPPQCPHVQGLRGNPISEMREEEGAASPGASWRFKLLNCAPGRHSSSSRYLNYKYGEIVGSAQNTA